ncbi:MAG: hypothetical protein WHV66_00060 [Anaerolineales bacterium]
MDVFDDIDEKPQELTIELWNPTERTGKIISNGEEAYRWTLRADEVYCDLCNATVLLRPVPVISGYALCLRCLAEVVPNWALKVPVEVMKQWLSEI